MGKKKQLYEYIQEQHVYVLNFITVNLFLFVSGIQQKQKREIADKGTKIANLSA